LRGTNDDETLVEENAIMMQRYATLECSQAIIKTSKNGKLCPEHSSCHYGVETKFPTFSFSLLFP
jgi:hypothetical protein